MTAANVVRASVNAKAFLLGIFPLLVMVVAVGFFKNIIDLLLMVLSHYPKCFESMTLIQPQYKGGAFKGPAKGQCLNCKDEQEYDLTVPVNLGDLIHALKSSHPKQTFA
jgi:hypothetical protein